MENRYIIPTYNNTYDEYGFGSWLKNNVGNIVQTIGGVALMATGAGAAAGLPMIASGVGGFANTAGQTNAEEQAQEDVKKQSLVQNRMNQLGNTINTANIPTFKKGGHLPEGNATLKDAEDYVKAFPEEMAMGEEVEYEHTGNKKLAQRIAADHIKDFLKMSGTPGYYSALKQAGISDELNKMEKGGYFERKNGTVYVHPDKRKAYDKWIKKYSLGGKLKNIPDLSFFPEGGKMDPVYPIQYGKTRSFSGSNYIFDPKTEADNNYFKPENIIQKGSNVAGTPNILPTMVGASPGFVDYTQRTDLPPAGYRSVNGADTTYTYRNQYKTAAGRDTVSYDPGTRQDVANAMHKINNPTGKDAFNPTMGVPSPSWHSADKGVSAYYEAIGKNRPNLFAAGGNIGDVLTEYKGGGTHEENPYGGIPVGGKARVEEGEYRFTDPDSGESYIFSNRF